jgi:hypothetical protein
MKSLTKDEKRFIVKFLKWTIGFIGCGVIYITLITRLRDFVWQCSTSWLEDAVLIIFGSILIYIGRKELPFRSIYFWLIFLTVGVVGLLKIFFYKSPNMGGLLTVFFIFAIFIFLFNKRKNK